MVNYWDKYTEMHGQQNVKKYRIKLHVQYSFPEDERKMFETCSRQEESNLNFNLKLHFVG